MYISRKLNKKLEKEKERFLKTWLLVWDILPLGRFCPWDILSLGRFVPWDVLSFGRLVLGRFVLECFVCASFHVVSLFSSIFHVIFRKFGLLF